jgi:hypothetical protein
LTHVYANFSWNLGIINNILVAVERAEIIDIPEGVEHINPDVFDDVGVAEWIRVPEGITCLGYKTFQWLRGDPNIILPESLTDTGGEAYKFEDFAKIYISSDSSVYEFLEEKYGYRRISIVIPMEPVKAKAFARMPFPEVIESYRELPQREFEEW